MQNDVLLLKTILLMMKSNTHQLAFFPPFYNNDKTESELVKLCTPHMFLSLILIFIFCSVTQHIQQQTPILYIPYFIYI